MKSEFSDNIFFLNIVFLFINSINDLLFKYIFILLLNIFYNLLLIIKIHRRLSIHFSYNDERKYKCRNSKSKYKYL